MGEYSNNALGAILSEKQVPLKTDIPFLVETGGIDFFMVRCIENASEIGGSPNWREVPTYKAHYHNIKEAGNFLTIAVCEFDAGADKEESWKAQSGVDFLKQVFEGSRYKPDGVMWRVNMDSYEWYEGIAHKLCTGPNTITALNAYMDATWKKLGVWTFPFVYRPVFRQVKAELDWTVWVDNNNNPVTNGLNQPRYPLTYYYSAPNLPTAKTYESMREVLDLLLPPTANEKTEFMQSGSHGEWWMWEFNGANFSLGTTGYLPLVVSTWTREDLYEYWGKPFPGTIPDEGDPNDPGTPPTPTGDLTQVLQNLQTLLAGQTELLESIRRVNNWLTRF